MNGSDLDQARRDQVLDHIIGLSSAAESVESAAASRPDGAERAQMAALAARLRQGIEQLRNELAAAAQPRAVAPAAADASARD